MILRLSPKIKDYFFVFISVLTMTLGFHSNVYKVVDWKYFNDFQKESESYVIGRLIASEKYGVFYRGGFNGSFYPLPNYINEYNAQVDIFKNNSKTELVKFRTYASQSGGQTIALALLNKVMPFSNATNLKIFWILTSVLTSLAFSLFLLWVKKNFGLIESIVVLVLLLLSPWVTVFGRNLWWTLWSFYLPFISLLFFYHKKRYDKIKLWHLSVLSFCLILIKCLYTGFEFITTVLVMSAMPILLYSLFNNGKLKTLMQHAASYALGALGALVFAIGTLSLQLSAVTGTVKKSVEYIFSTYLRRTSGSIQSEVEISSRSEIDTSFPAVLSEYWNGIAFDFNSYLYNTKWETLWQITFGELITVFAFFSILSFFLRLSETRKSRVKALIIPMWLSILAPISWIAVFRSHSAVHTHMNFIFWYMPFVLFGFLIVGINVSGLCKIICGYFENMFSKNRRKVYYILTVVALSVIGMLTVPKIYHYMLYKRATKTENIISFSGGYKICIYNNQLWYIKEEPLIYDKQARFFLDIVPVNKDNIPCEFKEYGVDNREFYFYGRNSMKFLPWRKENGDLIIIKQLPGYSLESINTGQHINDSIIWETGVISLF